MTTSFAYVICLSKSYCSATNYSPRVSFVLPGCVSGHIAERPDTQVWIWLPARLLSSRVWRVWGGFGLMVGCGGKRRRTAGGGISGGRENVGQHSQSPVTCSSQLESRLQSRPECYIRGYWSVRVHVGKWSSSWGWSSSLAGLPKYRHMVSQHGKQTCQSVAGGAKWLAQPDPISMRF